MIGVDRMSMARPHFEGILARRTIINPREMTDPMVTRSIIAGHYQERLMPNPGHNDYETSTMILGMRNPAESVMHAIHAIDLVAELANIMEVTSQITEKGSRLLGLVNRALAVVENSKLDDAQKIEEVAALVIDSARISEIETGLSADMRPSGTDFEALSRNPHHLQNIATDYTGDVDLRDLTREDIRSFLVDYFTRR